VPSTRVAFPRGKASTQLDANSPMEMMKFRFPFPREKGLGDGWCLRNQRATAHGL
jgi:hypothetical protein